MILGAQIMKLNIKVVHLRPQVSQAGKMGIFARLQRSVVVCLEAL